MGELFPTAAQWRALQALLEALPTEWMEARDDPEAHRKRLEAVAHHLEPDFATEAVGGAFHGAAPSTGLDGWLEMWEDWLRGFENFTTTGEGGVVADDRIIGLVRQWGIPAGGSKPIENAAAAVFWFRGDRIERVKLYLDRDEALRDAGIDPAEVKAPSRS